MATTPQHVCPRCGYDQAGHMATWSPEAWPVEGVCSECGLKFEWADVLSPDRSRLAWLYEHTPGWRIGARRFVRTCGALILPWIFWSRVKLRHVLVPRRLVVWLVLLFVPLWFLQATATTARTLVITGGMAPTVFGAARPVDWNTWLSPWLWPVGAGISGMGATGLRLLFSEWPVAVKVWFGMTIAMPLLLLVLSHSRRLAKVRPMHVWRAAAYSAAWVAVPLVVRLSFELAQLAEIVGAGFAGPRSRGTRFMPVVEAIGTVFLNFRGTITVVVFVWFALYWLLAITVGLKLERPVVIWFLLMIASVLFGLVLGLTVGSAYWLLS